MKMNKEIVMVRLSDIIPNRFQPRLAFDEDALNELAASIKEHGIIQPLILRDLGNKYEIIAGERRYKASQLAGVLEVPAVVGQMDDQTSAELALIENIQRKDLSAIEEAKSYKKILDMGGFTQEELAKRMGKGQSTIANKMRLLTLTNEVQAALMNNLISERHARCLLQIKDEAKQKEVLNKIIAERMNVRDTDNYIKNMLGMTTEEIKPKTEEFNNPIPSTEETTSTEKHEEKIVEEIKIPSAEETNDNPNVYKQTNNVDFIDLNTLTPENETINNENSQENNNKTNSGFENSSVEATTETVAIEEEKKDDDNMLNVNPVVEEQKNSNNDDFSKIKMATAIRLAKDAIESIKTAGYQASIEETDKGNSYQIIINIQK